MLEFLPDALWMDVLLVAFAVAVLWKAADWFVEGAVGIAERLKVPPMLVGLVLVSIGTTAPELMASLLAALQGKPDVALGNAIGSVIVNASLAIGLAAVVSSQPLTAHIKTFRTSAVFLVIVMVLCFALAFDGTLSRWEGIFLVALYVAYTLYSYHRARKDPREEKTAVADLKDIEAVIEGLSVQKITALFVAGLIGVVIGSKCLLQGAVGIAEAFRLPDVVIGLTVVAIGTSVPEIATMTASALKGHSSVGVGNIIGANILNICWVAGLSATANPLSSPRSVLLIMFPAMLIVVLTMLGLLRMDYKLVRWNGVVLLALYAIYLVLLLTVAPASVAEVAGS
jgi:cation:H+ antiporter